MNFGQRVSFISVSTIVIYSLSIFLNTNRIVFPYPIFDFILVINAVIFLMIDFKNEGTFIRKSAGTLLTISFFLCLCSNVYIGSFFRDEVFHNWLNSDYLNWIVFSYEIIWTASVLILVGKQGLNNILINGLVVVIFCLSQFESFRVLFLVLPIILFLHLSIQKSNIIWKHIFLTQGLFNLMTIYMFSFE